MITFDHTSKSYDRTPAITDLNLTIARGELLVLIGPSGSGKSTALKMINRMVDHDGGRILLDGQEIYSFNVRDLRRRMGYAIQSVGLFPHWTVARNIATVPQLLGWSAARIEAQVTELLTLFAMEPSQYRDRYPHQLSGGQQQRVGVARALAANPDVLLMDEPFGALDPVTRAALQWELKRVHQAFGTTIVLVTHDIDEALLLATRIVVMRQGRVEQVGTRGTASGEFNKPRSVTVDRKDNLYVVDASVFVSSAAVNPTLTIVANALRVGDHLARQLNG